MSIALAEGATEFFSKSLMAFRQLYPAIAYRLHIAGSQAVADLVLSGEYDVVLTFDPPETHALRVERTTIYQLGLVVPPGHPAEVSPAVCSDYPLVIPDETISLRAALDKAWGRTVGGNPRYAASVNSPADATPFGGDARRTVAKHLTSVLATGKLLLAVTGTQ